MSMHYRERDAIIGLLEEALERISDGESEIAAALIERALHWSFGREQDVIEELQELQFDEGD